MCISKIIRCSIMQYQRSTLKAKLFLIIFLQAAFLVIGYSYVIVMERHSLMQEYESRSLQACASLSASAGTTLQVLEYVSAFPVIMDTGSDKSELFNMLDTYENPTEDRQYLRLFRSNCKYYLDIYPFLDLIAIYDRNGNGNYMAQTAGSAMYETTCRIENPDARWYRETVAFRGGSIPLSRESFTDSGIYVKGGKFFCVTRSLLNINNNPFYSIGIIVVGIRQSYIDNIFESVGDRQQGQTYALYYKDTLVSSNMQDDPNLALILGREMPGRSATYTEVIGGRSYLYSVYRGDFDSLTIIRGEREGVYAQRKFSPYFYLLIAVFSLITFLVVYSIVGGLLIPIRSLVAACNQLAQENFSVKIHKNVSSEFRELFSAFNHMSMQIETLIRDVLTRDLAKRELELQLLRTQINPHYLYNTLECMRMITYQNGNPTVADMAELLAHNLHYGLHATNSEVPLSTELAALQEYITLITYSHKDRLHIEIQIGDELLSCLVIKLILQPIVENAINHGLCGRERLHIAILGYRSQGTLTLTVSDDGAGMSESRLDDLRRSLEDPDNSRGIGLKNVHRRLRLYYGDRYGIEIRSLQGAGTTASLYLPVKRSEERD